MFLLAVSSQASYSKDAEARDINLDQQLGYFMWKSKNLMDKSKGDYEHFRGVVAVGLR